MEQKIDELIQRWENMSFQKEKEVLSELTEFGTELYKLRALQDNQEKLNEIAIGQAVQNVKVTGGLYFYRRLNEKLHLIKKGELNLKKYRRKVREKIEFFETSLINETPIENHED